MLFVELRMKIVCVLLSFLLSTHVAIAAPLSAIMTFESMALTAEGVKKQTWFQEKFIRDTNTLWSQRIIPHAAHHDHKKKNHKEEDHKQEQHKHNLNFATAGKWLVRDVNNHIKFSLVRSEEKTIINPRVSEYGTLGFDGVWETAYYLVNRDSLKKMTVVRKAAPEGATWFEKKDTKQFTRILWDERKQIPLSIETASVDGTSTNKITLAITAAPSVLPWNTIGSYQNIDYEDLLD